MILSKITQKSRRSHGLTWLLLACLIPSLSLAADPDPEFDRLDGKGKSRRRVDVIEWEGNLEVHVYPGGALRGLALKLDDRDQSRKVMVLGYRFDTQPQKQLIRRALLGIPMKTGFHVYRDPSSGEEYDKIIITQHALGKPLLAYQTEPEPRQLYPEGHPLNTDTADTQAIVAKPSETSAEARKPASQSSGSTQTILDQETPDEQDGSIRPFQW